MSDAADVVLESARARLVLRPARGGLVTAWSVDGKPVLYLDPDTLADPTKNVRGGNPVLFPSPGKLADDAWARAGKAGAMKQHGFARNLPWRCVGTLGATAQLELTSSAASLAQFPWPCALAIAYSLRDNVLRLDLRVTNTGSEPLPFGVGFHPYFHVPVAEKASATVTTTATTVFDNVTKQTGPRPARWDFAHGELDAHLLDPTEPAIALTTSTRTIAVRGSRELAHHVLWTQPGKDFICVEPWTAPGDALNTGTKLLELAPGAVRELWVDYAVTFH